MADTYRKLRYQLAAPMAPLPVLYKDDLSVDHAALEAYVDWLMDNGAHNVCFTFTYTQLDFVTTEELLEMTRTVAAVVRGRGTFIGSTAGGPASQAIDAVRKMHAAGVDAVMVHQPEWVMQNGGTGPIMVDYLKTVAAQADGAVMCCLLPESWTDRAPLLGPDAFEQLVEHENFIGLKDDFYKIPNRMALIKKFGDRLAIVGGGDLRQYVLFHRFPCQGEFCGHFNPQWAIKLFRLMDENNYTEAMQMIEGWIDAAWTPEGAHWLAACQARYHAMGFASSYRMRPPLRTLTPAQAEAIVEYMRQHPELFALAR